MFNEEERPRKAPRHEVGQDLSPLSIEEIDIRVALLEGEIERLRAERSRKQATRGAADALFRLP